MTFTVKWKGKEVSAKERGAAGRGLYKAAEHLLEEATRLVPLQEGTLERSGVASVDEGALKAAVSYDTPYAVKQHEAMNFQHSRGQAKYLETPFNSESEKLKQIVADEIKRALGD